MTDAALDNKAPTPSPRTPHPHMQQPHHDTSSSDGTGATQPPRAASPPSARGGRASLASSPRSRRFKPDPVALNAANYDPGKGRRGAQRGRENGRVSPRNKRVGRLKGLPSRRPLPEGFPGPPPPPLPRPARPQARPFCQYQLTPFVSPALSLESIYIYTY